MNSVVWEMAFCFLLKSQSFKSKVPYIICTNCIPVCTVAVKSATYSTDHTVSSVINLFDAHAEMFSK